MKKEALFVLAAVFLLVFGATLSATILTPYARVMGAPWPLVGALTASMYLVRLVFGAPIGRLADRKGVMAILHLSLALFPFIAVAYWLARDVYALIGARLLHGVASAMLLPMAMAYVGQLSPPGEEGRYMGVYNTVYFVATGLGPVAATVIAGHYHSYRSTFVFLMAFSLLALATMSVSRGGRRGAHHARAPHETGRIVPARALIVDRDLLALSALQIALAVIAGLVGFFLLPFLRRRGVALVVTGSVIALYNLLTGLIQLPGGRLADRLDKYKTVLISGFATTAALLLFPFARGTGPMIAVTAATAVGSASLLAAASASAAEVGRRLGMGSTMGFLSTAYSAGMVLGCLALSLAPGGGDLNGFFYLAGGVTAMCVGFYAVLMNPQRRPLSLEQRKRCDTTA